MMRLRPVIALLAICLLVIPYSGLAAGIQFYEITTDILENGLAKNEVKIAFDVQQPGKIDYPIIGDVTDFSWAANFNATCDLAKQGATSIISCDLAGVNKTHRSLSLNYTASGFVRQLEKDRWIYRYDFQSSVPVTTLSIVVRLPEGKGLITSEDGIISGGLLPYAPSYGDTRTDGRRILIDWARNNFTAGDSLSVSAVYENIQINALTTFLPLFLTIVIILISTTVYFYLKKTKVIVRTEETLDSVLLILKPDERKVIDCLLSENGEKMQRKIVHETNFSKAKVSRLISDLKRRGIIYVEERGRTNRIFLKIKPKEPFGTIKPSTEANNEANRNDTPKS
ncbi:MAG: hypothetical protein V1836_02950 [Candidatus Aenigmatarchaeota archaeon]